MAAITLITLALFSLARLPELGFSPARVARLAQTARPRQAAEVTTPAPTPEPFESDEVYVITPINNSESE